MPPLRLCRLLVRRVHLLVARGSPLIRVASGVVAYRGHVTSDRGPRRRRMRDQYHEQLDSVGHTLVEMTQLVGQGLERATRALLGVDLGLAEAVISADDAVDALYRELDVRTLDLMARQQPVAGDLRTLVTSLRMSADLERMGDLARHV